MKKTLELYETQNGIKDNALLILGQAVKAGKKENTERWTKNLTKEYFKAICFCF